MNIIIRDDDDDDETISIFFFFFFFTNLREIIPLQPSYTRSRQPRKNIFEFHAWSCCARRLDQMHLDIPATMWLFSFLILISHFDAIEAKWRGGVGRWESMAYNYEEGADSKPPSDKLKTVDSKGKEVVVGTVLRAKWRKGETWYTGHVDLVNRMVC